MPSALRSNRPHERLTPERAFLEFHDEVRGRGGGRKVVDGLSIGCRTLKNQARDRRYYPHLAKALRQPSRYPAITARYCTRRERPAR